MTQKKIDHSTSSKWVDIIALLKADHENVKALFAEFEVLKEKANNNVKKKNAVKELCEELMLHALAEESIVYPVAREVINDEDLMDEAEVEHAGAKELISQLESMSPNESHFDAKVSVLRDYVEHHVQKEESKILPKLAKAEIDTLAMAEEVIQFKENHKSAIFSLRSYDYQKIF